MPKGTANIWVITPGRFHAFTTPGKTSEPLRIFLCFVQQLSTEQASEVILFKSHALHQIYLKSQSFQRNRMK